MENGLNTIKLLNHPAFVWNYVVPLGQFQVQVVLSNRIKQAGIVMWKINKLQREKLLPSLQFYWGIIDK